MRRFLFGLFTLLALAFVSLHVSVLLLPVPRSKLSPAPVVSLEIRDRNGLLLWEVLSDRGGRSRWVALNEISPHLVKATIATEDRNFPFHSGIDWRAVLRASFQNLHRGRIVSGASTITQQLARNLWPARRTLLAKLGEAWLALRLERTLAKEEILVQYFNRVFYGNQAYGAEAASRLYFGKPCSELSLAEAAFLAALPRSPSVLNPYRSPEALASLIKRQRAILDRMERLGFCTAEEVALARDEKLRLLPAETAFRAPHFCDWVLSSISASRRRGLSLIQTTLDYPLQQKIETMLRGYLDSLADRGITNGAVVVLDNVTDEVLAHVGSRDYFDETSSGQVNGALARRQPGSALKPFTYGLALEKGWTAASIVEDMPAAFPTATGAYMPLNFDRRFHGPMSLRTALACSYNVPAVSLLERLGPDLLYRRLKELGFESLGKGPAHYGVGLTLGNGEVTLLELVRAYATLARRGVFRPEKTVLRLVPKMAQTFTSQSRRIFSDQVAYIITDILADRDARVPSFGYLTPLSLPFPVAAKTGTSKDFRDNWTVGYTPRYTVGVWVGNFDGKPMNNVSGITGCGPLFHDIMLLLHGPREEGRFEEPEGIVRRAVCPESGELLTAFCPGAVEEIFIAGTEPRTFCSHHSAQTKISSLQLTSSSSPPPPSSSILPFIPGPLVSPSSFSPAPSTSAKTPHNIPTAISSSRALTASAKPAVAITFPQDGDVFKIDPVLRAEHQRLKLRAVVSAASAAGNDVVEWVVNGRKIGECVSPPFVFFWNLKPGTYTIKAKFRRGTETAESRPVRIHVLG